MRFGVAFWNWGEWGSFDEVEMKKNGIQRQNCKLNFRFRTQDVATVITMVMLVNINEFFCVN